MVLHPRETGKLEIMAEANPLRGLPRLQRAAVRRIHIFRIGLYAADWQTLLRALGGSLLLYIIANPSKDHV